MQPGKQTFIFLSLCVLSVLGAPTANKQRDDETESHPMVQQAETDLEKLAGVKADKLKNAIYEKSKSFSYSNVNGEEKTASQSEGKVINGNTGNVVADVKQEVKNDPLSGKPKTQTVIDIPVDGIHETFTNEESQQENGGPIGDQLPDYSEAFQFTPSAVAEYLIQTGEFQAFEEALSDLVNSSIMTQEQAVDYKENVRKEYNRLVQQANNILSNDVPRNVYPYTYDLPPGDVEYLTDSNGQSEEIDAYPGMAYASIIPHLGIEELESKDMMQEAITRASSLIELIKGLMDEWLTRAIVTGDPEAERLLGDILKEVSKDNDPDDLSQLRETLYDFFANEVLNSLEKRPNNYEEYALIEDPPVPTEPQPEETKAENGTESKDSEDKISDEADNNTEEKEDKAPVKEENEKTKIQNM